MKWKILAATSLVGFIAPFAGAQASVISQGELPNSGVTPGVYSCPSSETVDTFGRVTAIAAGTCGGGAGGGVTAAQLATALGAQTAAQLNPVRNLFSAANVAVGLVAPDGSIFTGYGSGFSYATIPVAGLTSIVSNETFQLGGDGSIAHFYDALGNVIAGGPTTTTTAGTPLTVPAGAAIFKFWDDTDRFTNLAYSIMVVPGTTLPGIYLPSLTTGIDHSYPFAGQGLAVYGDSLSASTPWPTDVARAHRMTLRFNHSLSSRIMAGIFDDYSTSTSLNSQLVTELANVDVVIIWLGNTDVRSGVTLGAYTDTPALGPSYSYCANMRAAIETLLTAKPNLRIIFLTPWIQSTAVNVTYANVVAWRAAMTQVAEFYGAPVVNMVSNGSNQFNWSTNLGDGLHPTTAGEQVIISPQIIHGITPYGRNY